MVKFRQLLMVFMAIAMMCVLSVMLSVKTPAQSTAPASSAAEPAVVPALEAKPATEAISLPGKGLAQHPFLYCGEWDTRKPEQTMFIIRGGKVTWTYSVSNKEELDDCTMLTNGNIVFARRTGAGEVTPDKKIVWNYDAPEGAEVHTAQPVGKDKVLIMQNGNPAKLMLINKKSGKVEKELTLPTRDPNHVHGQFRHIRMTKTGNFLVAHLDLGKVVEYSKDGKELWSVPAPSAWAAVNGWSETSTGSSAIEAM